MLSPSHVVPYVAIYSFEVQFLSKPHDLLFMPIVMVNQVPVADRQSHRRRAEEMCQQARMLDASAWCRLAPEADVYDYLKLKLNDGLSTWRKPGQAAWAFRTSTDIVRKGMIFTDGDMASTSQSRYDGTVTYGERWWPCIFTVPVGTTDIVPYYCPGLAWQNGRPWCANITRLLEFPPPPPPVQIAAAMPTFPPQPPPVQIAAAMPTPEPTFTTTSSVEIEEVAETTGIDLEDAVSVVSEVSWVDVDTIDMRSEASWMDVQPRRTNRWTRSRMS